MINAIGGKKKFAKWFQENISNSAGFESKGKNIIRQKRGILYPHPPLCLQEKIG